MKIKESRTLVLAFVTAIAALNFSLRISVETDRTVIDIELGGTAETK